MDRPILLNGCPVIQPKLDRLDIDVVDHRALPVNTRDKKCFFANMMVVAVAVHHVQPFCYHGHTDRRNIDVATLRTTVPDRVQDPIYLSAFYVLCNSFYPHTKAPESTKARGV